MSTFNQYGLPKRKGRRRSVLPAEKLCAPLPYTQPPRFHQKQKWAEPRIPKLFHRDMDGRPEGCNPFSGYPTPFPKPNLVDQSVNESLPVHLKHAVCKSIVRVKQLRIQSRFDQLAIDTGLTRGELEVLRATKYDRSVFEELLIQKWQESGGSGRLFRTANPVITTWINPKGKKCVDREELTLCQLYEWKCQAEDELRTLDFQKVLSDPNTEVDWEFVSKILIRRGHRLTPERCENLYKYVIGGHIRQLPSWTQDDLDKLKSIVKSSSGQLHFYYIAEKMGRGFTPVVCLKAYNEMEKFKINRESSRSRNRPLRKIKRYSAAGAGKSKHKIMHETSSSESEEDDAELEFNDAALCPMERRMIMCNVRGRDFNEKTACSIKGKIEQEEEDLYMKRTPFIDVEDAILITAIQQFKWDDGDETKDFEASENILDYLGVDITGILPWRLDKSVEARLNILFRQKFMPWSLWEDQRLLGLSWMFKNNLDKISDHFKEPYRCGRSLFARLRVLRENLEFVTLEEFHRFVYSKSNEVLNSSRPYALLRRSLTCLETLWKSKMQDRDWVSQYISIHAPIKKDSLIDTEAGPSSVYNETRKYVRRNYSSVQVKKETSCHKAITEDDGDDDPEELPEALTLLGIASEVEVCDNSELGRGKELEDEPLEDISSTATYDSLADTDDFFEFKTDFHSNRRAERRNLAGYIANHTTPVDDPRPPGPTELIHYLWNMDIKYIRKAYEFIQRFLMDRKVPLYKTGTERRKPFSALRGRGFNRDNCQSLAAAAYLRKVEFKSDDDLAQELVSLSSVEESILSWYKWYTKTDVLKRTVKRKIPEKTELLLYPELRRLIHKKYTKQDVKMISIESTTNDSKSESTLELKLDTNEQWELVSAPSPTPGQEVPPHDEPSMECAHEHVASMESGTIGIESDLVNGESDVSIPIDRCGGEVDETCSANTDECVTISTTPFPTLKTITKGKGKKVSRKSALRREIANLRWAKRKALLEESAKKDDDVSLTAEQ